MSATARARHAVEIAMLGRSTISAAPLAVEATVASLRADLASGDPGKVREAAEALGLDVRVSSYIGGSSMRVLGPTISNLADAVASTVIADLPDAALAAIAEEYREEHRRTLEAIAESRRRAARDGAGIIVGWSAGGLDMEGDS